MQGQKQSNTPFGVRTQEVQYNTGKELKRKNFLVGLKDVELAKGHIRSRKDVHSQVSWYHSQHRRKTEMPCRIIKKKKKYGYWFGKNIVKFLKNMHCLQRKRVGIVILVTDPKFIDEETKNNVRALASSYDGALVVFPFYQGLLFAWPVSPQCGDLSLLVLQNSTPSHVSPHLFQKAKGEKSVHV